MILFGFIHDYFATSLSMGTARGAIDGEYTPDLSHHGFMIYLKINKKKVCAAYIVYRGLGLGKISSKAQYNGNWRHRSVGVSWDLLRVTEAKGLRQLTWPWRNLSEGSTHFSAWLAGRR